jgi:hypothetical protein
VQSDGGPDGTCPRPLDGIRPFAGRKPSPETLEETAWSEIERYVQVYEVSVPGTAVCIDPGQELMSKDLSRIEPTLKEIALIRSL